MESSACSSTMRLKQRAVIGFLRAEKLNPFDFFNRSLQTMCVCGDDTIDRTRMTRRHYSVDKRAIKFRKLRILKMNLGSGSCNFSVIDADHRNQVDELIQSDRNVDVISLKRKGIFRILLIDYSKRSNV